MAALVLQIIALVAVVLSFLFAALVLTVVQARDGRQGSGPSPGDEGHDDGGAAETMARVIAEIERLAALRERGVLTDKEFSTQKARLLRGQP
jgi:hypothetical protein